MECISDELSIEDLYAFLDWLILFKGWDVCRANDLVVGELSGPDLVEARLMVNQWRRWREAP